MLGTSISCGLVVVAEWEEAGATLEDKISRLEGRARKLAETARRRLADGYMVSAVE